MAETLRIGVPLFLLVALALSPETPSEETLRRHGPPHLDIGGRVTNAQGTPIPGVHVLCGGTGFNSRRRAETDPEGRYVIEGLATGAHFVAFTHPRYSRARHEDVQAGSKDVDIVLEGRGRIVGVVKDAHSDQPITDFEVVQLEAVRDPTVLWRDKKVQHIQNELGRFELNDVEVGVATIIVRADEAVGSVLAKDIRPDETRPGIVIKLKRGAVIRGIVRDDKGRPLEGILIYDDAPRDTWQRRHGNVVSRTAPDGTFVIAGVAPRLHTISAWFPEYAPTTIQIEARVGRSEPTEIRLGRGGAIEGKVQLGGRSLANVRIWSRPAVSFGVIYANGETDPQGIYRMEGLSVGATEVYLDLETHDNEFGTRRSITRTVEVQNGKTIRLDFHMPLLTAAVEGRVFVEGVPAHRASLQIVVDGPFEREIFSTRSRTDGRYRLDNVPSGTVSLNATATLLSTGGAAETRETSVRIETAPGKLVKRDFRL